MKYRIKAVHAGAGYYDTGYSFFLLQRKHWWGWKTIRKRHKESDIESDLEIIRKLEAK